MSKSPHPAPHLAKQHYLNARVMQATPEQLQMMLYEGAIRFAEAARSALDRRDLEAVCANVTKAQAIVTELLGGLRPTRAPGLCGRLGAEYRYVYRKLVEVGFQHKTESADAALVVLRHQRDTWALLLAKVGHEKAASRSRGLAINPSVPASLSIAA